MTSIKSFLVNKLHEKKLCENKKSSIIEIMVTITKRKRKIIMNYEWSTKGLRTENEHKDSLKWNNMNIFQRNGNITSGFSFFTYKHNDEPNPKEYIIY